MKAQIMRSLLLTCAAAFLLAGSSISQAQASDNTILGTGLGAAIGGLFGSQISRGNVAATGIGVALGGLIGNDIGHRLDADEPYYPGPRYAYVEPGNAVFEPYQPNYVAPPTPTPIYVDEDHGTYCREYSERVRIDGQMHESFGTACLQPDGTWRVVD